MVDDGRRSGPRGVGKEGCVMPAFLKPVFDTMVYEIPVYTYISWAFLLGAMIGASGRKVA